MTIAFLHLSYRLEPDGQTQLRLPPRARFARFDPFRHARPARALLNTAYREGGGLVEDFEIWWPRLEADAEYDPELCFVVIDEADNSLIGFAQCWTSAFIKDIAVASSWRQSGVGTALMQRIFKTFEARGESRVDLKVETGNPNGARAFYTKLGMVPAQSSR